MLRAHGGVWHKKDRDKGEVPPPLPLIPKRTGPIPVGMVGYTAGSCISAPLPMAVWIPLAAELTPANVADNEPAPALIYELPPEVHFVLGDRHYNAPNVREACARGDRTLVATQYGSQLPPPEAAAWNI